MNAECNVKTIVVSQPADGILQITLHRPEALNALSSLLYAELAAALREADADDAVRCVVLTGGRKAFSAGADIKEMPGPMPPFVTPQRVADRRTIEGFAKPLIAAVNGYVLGGGCELMLTCDIVVAGTDAQIGMPEVCIAAYPGGGGTQWLAGVVGTMRAMQMVLTGTPISAVTAAEWGLVNEVVAPEDAVPRAIAIAQVIAANSPVAVRLAKRDILRHCRSEEDIASSLELKMLLWQSADHDEGISAFNERRPPRFPGR